MANFSIPITIPTDDVNDHITALRFRYGQKQLPDGTLTDYTPAEVRALFGKDVRSLLSKYYTNWKNATDPRPTPVLTE